MAEEQFEQAQDLIADKQFAEALKILDQLIADDSTVPDYYFQKGQTYFNISMDQNGDEKQKSLQQALDNFKLTIEKDNDYSFVYYVRGQVQDALKNTEEAINDYNKSIEKNEFVPNSHYGKGQIYQNKKDFHSALQSYLKAMETEGQLREDESPYFQDQEELYQNMGIVFYNLQQYEQAIDSFQKSLEKNAKNFQAHNLIGQCYNHLNKPDLANQAFDKAVALNPSALKDVQLSKARALIHSHKYDDALKILEEIVSKDANNYDAIYEKGNIFLLQSQYDKAVQNYQILIQLKPNDPYTSNIYNNMGIAQKKLNKISDALNSFDQAVKLNHKNIDALINKGSLLDDQKEYDKSLEVYNQVIAEQPNKAEVYNNKGIVLVHKQLHEEAYKSFSQAIALNPKQILAFTNRASVDQILNRQDQALKDLKHAKSLLSDTEATNKLSQDNIKFIENGITKIIELEEKFKEAGAVFEEQIENTAQPKSKKEQELIEQYLALKKQKEAKAQQEYQAISKTQPQQAQVSGVQQQNQQQLQTQATQPQTPVQTGQSNEELLAKINELTKLLVELKQGDIEQEQELKRQNEIIESLAQQTEKINETLSTAGVYDKANLIENYKKFKEMSNPNDFESRKPELLNYSQAFYWTLLNYFDGARVANTGLLQNNVHSAEDKKQAFAVKAASTLLNFGSKVPIFGSIFSILDSAVNGVYEKVVEKRYEDRIRALNEILMKNKDPNAQDLEGFSLILAKASQRVALQKLNRLQEICNSQLNKKPEEQSVFKKAFNFIQEKVKEIQTKALGEEIELYDSVGAGEALQDTILVLAFLYKNHTLVIQNNIPLDEQIYKIVVNKNYQEILQNFGEEKIVILETAKEVVDSRQDIEQGASEAKQEAIQVNQEVKQQTQEVKQEVKKEEKVVTNSANNVTNEISNQASKPEVVEEKNSICCVIF